MFGLVHANIVAYLTSRFGSPPRILRRHLGEFLSILFTRAGNYIIGEKDREAWPEQISAMAGAALIRLESVPESREDLLVPAPIVGGLLKELRSQFDRYPIYALAVGDGYPLQELARELAVMPTNGQLLVLIPDYASGGTNLDVLDPLPSFSAALHAAPEWPGVLFWSQTGVTAFARFEEVFDLAHKLQEVATSSLSSAFEFSYETRAYLLSRYDHVLRDWSSRKHRRYRRLLHLSDLHFGTSEALGNQAILEAELRDVVQTVNRVVITGDLFDTPKSDYATLFTNFRNNITHLAGGKEPISITGNHDQRMIGIFGENYKQVALIGSRKIVVDDDCKMIFVCFNSSENGVLARGLIGKSQFQQLGGEYRTLTAARPELRNYLPIVLVHHHPFSFDVPSETLTQRFLRAIGIREDITLQMVDAVALHHWCVDWNVKTILHGHKHKARYEEREIFREDEQMYLTAIGCGSSLGAEGFPVSYNLLEWDEGAQRWMASFFQSENGGAFREIRVAVSAE